MIDIDKREERERSGQEEDERRQGGKEPEEETTTREEEEDEGFGVRDMGWEGTLEEEGSEEKKEDEREEERNDEIEALKLSIFVNGGRREAGRLVKKDQADGLD